MELMWTEVLLFKSGALGTESETKTPQVEVPGRRKGDAGQTAKGH